MNPDRRPRVLPVILSGGSGARLWPLSTPALPKQFHRLATEGSLLQDTARRFVADERVEFLAPMVICNQAHGALVERQLAEAGFPDVGLVLEPFGRNTAAAAAVAAEIARQLHPGALVLLVPADHVINDPDGFRAAIVCGAANAEERIVTFGLRPTAPETGFGYIQQGSPIGDGVFEVVRFAEKPNLATARNYLADGRYLWNAGIFLFRPDTMLLEMRRTRADIADAALHCLERSRREGGVWTLDEPTFADCPSESLDYAVMEHTRLAAVTPCDIGWADIGSWSELWRLSARDARDNAVHGDVLALDSDGSLVRAEDCTVVTLGIRDLVVVAASGHVLVTHKERAQDLKLAVDALKSRAPAAPGELAQLSSQLRDWLMRTALPLWAKAGVAPDGGFQELLRLEDARPVPANRRFRVQARQIFVYALAGRMGWEGPWQALCERGLAVIENCYRRTSGLVRTAVHPDGSPADDAATLYDQAFALFAQAEVTRAGVCDLSEVARDHLAAIRNSFGGGWALRENGGESAWQSNPHMHLFEAALAWSEVDADPVWPALADELGDLCLNRFIDRECGFVREFFDDRGRPAPGEAGRIVEPGHQFEWAWLLARWGLARGSDTALNAARTLFEFGERWGVDRRRGVAVDAIGEDGAMLRGVARLWPQTERLKAALILRDQAPHARGRAAYETAATSAGRALLRYLDVPTPGLWRDKLRVDNRFVDEPAPASSFYHLALAIAQLG